MKKLVSLALAALLILAAFACCFSVSAATKKDPTFTADKSLITGKDDAGFYTNNFSAASKACNKTYSGDAVTIGISNTPISVFGVAGAADSQYLAVVGNYKVDASTPVKSLLLSFNADATDIIDELEVFASDDTWKAVTNNKTPATTPSDMVITPVAKIEKIQESLVESADGTFKYVELNLFAPVTAGNYFIAFTEASKKGLPEGTKTIHFAEIALFADEIPGAVTADIPAVMKPTDYLKEAAAPEGKIDVLEGVEATFYVDPAVKADGIPQGTLLTDGIISANKFAESTPFRIHLNDQCAKDGYQPSVEVPGVNGKFFYTLQFNGLGKVSIDRFDIYYAGQKDDTLKGRDIPATHAEKDITILYSTDNGATYKVAFASQTNGTFGSDETYTTAYTVDGADGAAYDCRKSTVTLTAPITGVTNLIYASNVNRIGGGNWPSRISEISAYGTKPVPEATTAEQTTAAPVTTRKPVETRNLDTSATPTTDAPATEAPKTEEKGCGSVAAIGAAVIVTVLGTAVLRKKD